MADYFLIGIVVWVVIGCIVSPLLYYIDLLGGSFSNDPSNMIVLIAAWPIPFIAVLSDVCYYLVQHYKGR